MKVKSQWLKDKFNKVLAPNTLTTSVYDNDGGSLESLLDNSLYMGNDEKEVSFPIADVNTCADDVGIIIPHMGKKPPKHYLVCDGTVYNISDYKLLSEFIKKEFGSYNFFGGNGTTTFAVPDLRGEFLRGSGTNSHANQGNGADVGVHQNATEIPVFGGLTNEAQLLIVANNEQYTAFGGYDSARLKSTRQAISTVAYTQGYTSGNTIATTRPTNTSVLWCIKYESNEYVISPKHNYSTEERVVGTWIDGKKIYQRSILIESTISLGNTWKNIMANSFSIEKLLKHEIYDPNYSANITLMGLTDGGSNIRALSPISLGINTNSYITLWYTKTTD